MATFWTTFVTDKVKLIYFEAHECFMIQFIMLSFCDQNYIVILCLLH